MRTKRAVLSFFLVFALLAPLTSALAGFEAVRDYPPGYFADVPEESWSAPYIREAYELGLMSGTGEGEFSPKGQVSVAQVVTVAVRLNDLYHGGSGVVEGGGAHWYDAAAARAVSLGVVSAGQFDEYERPATRAEVAGTLARALPAAEFAAVRSVASLPDVDAATPYAKEIFTLYAAGVLTGNDGYGTYTPDAELTREAFAAILCRICKPETRSAQALLPKPADLTARTSDRLVVLNGVPVYGAVVIDGDYYLPASIFRGSESILSGAVAVYEYKGKADLNFARALFVKQTAAPDYCLAPPNGTVLGVADAAPDFEWDGRAVRHMTLGGRYHMFRLSDVADGGMTVRDDKLIVSLKGVTPASPTPEEDLVGRALAGLLRETPRDTVKAIHDYLIKTLTYDPDTEESYAREEASFKKYQLYNNVTLDSGYAVCEEYSCLFMEMCVRAGIPCEFVSGAPSHAWNRVWVDGEWLYMDVTWDDTDSAKNPVRYTYFLVGAEVMANGHYWVDDDYPFTNVYDPAWEELDPQNITSADMFRKCLCAQVKMGVNPVRLRVTKSGAYGGTGCLYAIPELDWWVVRGGYDNATGEYVYYFNELSGY